MALKLFDLFGRDNRKSPIEKITKKYGEIIVALDGTGDTDSISEALKLVDSGGEIYVKSGTYKINSKISISKSNIIIRGNRNSTILQAVSSGKMIEIDGKENVIIYNLGFDANSIANVEGIYISGNAKNINVSDCIFQNFGGSFCIEISTAERLQIKNNKSDDGDGFVIAANCNKSIVANNHVLTSTIFFDTNSDNNIIIGNITFDIELAAATCNKNIIIANQYDSSISDSGTDTTIEHNVNF